jgi:hypothetical protein
LSGLVIHELRWQSVLRELTDFRRWLRRRYGIGLADELHHAEMVGKDKNLSPSIATLPKHQRLAIIRHHADQLARLPDFNVINVVVDKSTGKVTDKDLVFRGAWSRLIQRFEKTIQYRNFPGEKNPSERGMIFPDRTDGERLRTLLNRMRRHNPIKLVSQAGSFHFENQPVLSVIEDPIVRESQLSYFVQSADLCVFLLTQWIEPTSFMKKHGGNAYFRRLEPILCKVASSTDANGIVRL